MKKLLIMLVAVLCLTLVFVACDKDKEDPTEAPTTAPTDAPTEEPTEEPTEPPHVHTPETVAGKAATCTEKGLTEGSKCSECGEVIQAQTEIAALGHKWSAVYATDADSHWQTCDRCDQTQGNAEHTYNENSVCTTCGFGCDHEHKQTTTTNPTCSAEGSEVTVCDDCGATVKSETLQKLPHTPGAAATCTTNQICTVCETELVAALGHTEAVKEAVDATCTEDGKTEGIYCSVCDEILVAQETVDAIGHADENTDNVCDNCETYRGSETWPFDLELGQTTTPVFANNVTAWYYTYKTTAGGQFTAEIEGADVSLTVDGKAVDGTSTSVDKNDVIVVCVTKSGDNSAAATLKTSFHLDINIIDTNVKSYISYANQSTTELGNEGDEYFINFTTTAAADPYFMFNIKNYQQKALKIPARNLLNSEFKYILVKVKAENCTPSMMMAYFQTSSSAALTEVFGSEFLPGHDGWHYVYFNMADLEAWSGTLTMLRLDLHGASAPTNTVYVSSVIGFTTYKDALCYAGVDLGSVEKPELTPEEEAEKNELLSGTTPDGGYESYIPETAEKEDSDINLWFNHTYTRTPQTQVTPGSLFSYKLMLAKNEAEACQLILSTEVAKNGLTIEMTDFIHTNGIDKMESDLLQGYYFEVDGKWIIDPTPPAGVGSFSTFDIAANNSQTFIVKAISKSDSAAGEYSATVVVKDAEGNEIKKVTVFAYVWNFELPEDTSCKTLMDLCDYYSLFGVYSSFDPNFSYVDPDTGEMSDTYNFIVNSDTYGNYYKFLLEYRICAYSIPGIESNGKYGASTMEYLNNPRVVAFINLGWSNNKNENFNAQNLQNAYNSLTNEDGTPKLDAAGNSLLDKAHFYPVDEPGDQGKLDAIIRAANLIKENYSEDYHLIAPMHMDNHATNSEGKVVDFFEYVRGAVTSWCPKTFFFTTMAEYANNTSVEQGTSIFAENTLGLFKDRMAAEQKAGNDVWWYVTRKPNDPEITLAIDQDAVEYRVLFWQQKLYNVDGFLYYLCSDWAPASDNAPIDNKVQLHNEYVATGGWYSKHEISTASNYDVYGNGVLIYPGFKIALDYLEPVGSLRLECIRDGIEDFEYFTILEELIGKEKVDMIINEMTTSVIDYSTDAEYFTALHEAIGSLVEAELNK